ncbi:MAG: carboxyl-terminal processing protease [Acetobacteraceae bacterium]|jgi:carboxyl-terminal processing protease|nr:carboxyl-terminal processing protease [Acetobacteraceae bacterium]
MKITKIGVALLVGTSFAAGCAVASNGGMFPAAAQGTDQQQTYRLLTLFNNVLDRVRADYVEPIPDRMLMENALNGMLTGLDPHSSYMTDRQWQDMQTETSGKFGGIGLEVTDNGGLLQVISPIDGTPAAAAGLLPGDLITAVDGKTVQGLSLNDAVAEMRGSPNTTVRLIVKREGVSDPITVTLTRQIIQVETVKSRLIGDIGVIRISEFTERSDPGVRAAMKSLRAEAGGHLRGLILDLRNDPGGLLDQAIAVSNDFLPSGGIVSTRGRHPEDNQSWSANPGDDISGGLPIVVLTNNGSASASEIVAGALQDDHRALVLGTRSFGKGSVQTIFPLPQGNGAIRLTTARYFTPSGRSIQGVGITPNVEVQQTRTPPPHFAPEHEADLQHVLTVPGGDKDAPAPPPADMPTAAAQIPKLPPENWPKLDPAKPATDFQLQQGLVLVRAMASESHAASR